jgi:tRNA-splicing ligase RtcB (3'-phosphate/5'-hydroxy nucleic acid ligase)
MGVVAREPTGLVPEAGSRVRLIENAALPADRAALRVLRAGVRHADLAAPAVALPDFHHKDDKEMPSSIVVATRSTIQPTYTSASLNCGMALVTTDIDLPGDAAVAEFYRRFRESYPYPPSYRRDLTGWEVVRCAAEGADFAAERFGVHREEVSRVELGGRVDVAHLGGAGRVRRELPWSVRQLGRIRFGTIGPSNHFLELQEVAEVFDPAAAAALGLALGQVTLQYHGGGGSLPGELGLLFGRRKRRPRAVGMQMAVQKPLYHFGRARSIAELRRRRALFFSDDPPPVDRSTAEGEQLSLANAMAMNYGFAFRLSTYARLRVLLHKHLGARSVRLLVDTSHNSIYEEEVDGEPAIVHRHNACRIFPASELAGHPVFARTGQPLLLPGTGRTSSYVCIPGEHPERSLHSVCHGAGSVVAELSRRAMPTSRAGCGSTLRFTYGTAPPARVPHIDDAGIDAVVDLLRDSGIIRPVVRLRPFAGLT